jgi:acetyltransferase
VTATLEEEEFFRDNLGFPVFHFPGQAVRALAYSRSFAQRPKAVVGERSPWLNRDKISALLEELSPAGFLPMTAALSLVTHLGIPVVGWQTAATGYDALAAAGDLGYPVCMKLSAPSLVHKTEVGGVILDLYSPEDVSAAFVKLAEVAESTLPSGETWDAVLMPQVAGGEEIIIGAHRDHTFGPVIAFGAGGIWTEALEDVALRVAPISHEEAWSLMLETKIGQILQGARGRPAVDLTSLCRALTALSQLMMAFPQIQEVDLNPVRVFPGSAGILALDARVRVG